MSYPASATEPGQQLRLSELSAAVRSNLAARAAPAATVRLLPADTCAYIPSFPDCPRAHLEIVAPAQGRLDPVPHVAARRVRPG